MPLHGGLCLELDFSELSQELIDWAKEKIREDPNTRCQMIDKLRDMIFSEGECTPQRTDDEYLLRFLRSRNFLLQKAYKLFVDYHDFREENPNFYEGSFLTQLRKFGEHNILTVPPYREQTGRRMMILRFGNWNPQFFTTDDIFKSALIALELAVLEPRFQILGGICIFDFANVTVQHALYMTPGIAHKIFQIFATSFPIKVMAVHIVNQSWAFEIIFNLFKPLLDDGTRSRLFFHGNNWESLHQHIDPEWLPEEYGGRQPANDFNVGLKYIRNNDFLIKELVSLGYTAEEEEDYDYKDKHLQEDSQ